MTGTTLVILTLNEIEGLRHVFPKIPAAAVDEVLAVDGGSTDGTLEFFADHGVRTVRQTKRGRGEAFRLAARAARHDWLVFFSPDGNEDPNDIPRLVQGLADGHDMVIASRFMAGARSEDDDKFLFASRRWGNLTFTWLANALWPGRARITDTINGFRAVTRSAFERLAPDAEGYAIEFQMSMRALQLRLRVLEIPTVESERFGKGVSKLHAIPVGLQFLRLMVKERLRPIRRR
ncbi:MAG: glycosyltransferase family 2 protein [Candidatus Rokubacteria bacterium]|nr:glycosyltransferase family 2 protein [Candidatus Rokubacteria bacterium]